MKVIKTLEDLIEEEIHDVKKYAKLAVEYKEDHPALAQLFYNLSTQEDGHQSALHAEVVKIIEDHRRTHGDPPPEMMAIYDYVHKKHIESLAKARLFQDMYKK